MTAIQLKGLANKLAPLWKQVNTLQSGENHGQTDPVKEHICRISANSACAHPDEAA